MLRELITKGAMSRLVFNADSTFLRLDRSSRLRVFGELGEHVADALVVRQHLGQGSSKRVVKPAAILTFPVRRFPEVLFEPYDCAQLRFQFRAQIEQARSDHPD
jgi:hypothetical protein